MKSTQKGFTLIELMIVVAIIGILAAIAIPAYQDYTVRSQVTEGLNLASAVETGVAEYYANTGSFPPTNSEAGIGVGVGSAPSGKYVTDVEIAAGGITVTYGNQVNANITGGTLGLTPYLSPNHDVVWVCGRHTAPTGATIGTGVTAGVTSASLADKYLSQVCRTGAN
ncbi:MAG TPA: pilin [Steroidobacteraceae bacterium]|jgi:type IV pilus assembly protein PilA|nr:pilin [Steroidobacteraceae bacterium]